MRPLVRAGGRTRQLPLGEVLTGIPGGCQAVFDGAGQPIAVGARCEVRVPYGMRLVRATVLGDAPGQLQVDVRVAPLVAYPPGGADSIVGAAYPSLAGASSSEDIGLSGWSTTVPANSVVQFVIVACADVGRATVILDGERI